MKGKTQVTQLFTVAGVICALMLVFSVGSTDAASKTNYTAKNPLVLKVATWAPATATYVRANGWILKEVEKRSKGRIKFEVYYSGSLIPARETLPGLQSGVADVAYVPTAYAPGKTPLCTVTSLPMTDRNFYTSAMAFADLAQTPEVKAELDKYNISYLSFLQTSSYHFFMNKPIASIKDIKGKKIRAIGMQSALLKELGAVPVSIVATEIYTALERGTLDGLLGNKLFPFDYKLVEIAKHVYETYLGSATFFMGINKDSLNKIPADIQQMFLDFREEAARKGHEIFEKQGDKYVEDYAAKGKLTVKKSSPEEMAHVRKVAKETVWKSWVEKMNKKGLPGQKVLDNWLNYQEKWAARNPFK